MSARQDTGFFSSLIITGALAAVYAIVTQFSLLISIPPWNMPLFWPPAGIAVTALIILGIREAIPGIWLGMFLASLWSIIMTSVHMAEVAMALVIATATTTQSVVLVSLLRHYTLFGRNTGYSSWPPLSQIIKAILIVALTCVISASLSVATIAIGTLMPSAVSTHMWLAWWLGDTLGIILLTPPLVRIALWLQIWSLAQRIALIVIDIGLVISIALFFILNQMETERINEEFHGDGETSALVLHNIALQYQHDVEVIQALYAASNHNITRDEFKAFVQIHLEGAVSSPGLQALVWAPIVPAESRTAFEDSLHHEGFTNAMIFERTSDGRMVRAGDHEQYVVANYNEPIDINRSAVGFDFSSDPIRRAALEQARDSGQAVATAPTKLVINEIPGFLIFMPIYQVGTSIDTVAARRAHIQSYAIGAFRLHDLMNTVMQASELADIDIYLFDQSSAAGDQLFYVHSARSRPVALTTENNIPINQLLTGPHYTATIEIAGRSWQMIAKPSPAFIIQRHTWVPWAALIFGIIFSIWVARTLLQRQLASEAVRRSEERFRALIEKSANAFSLISANGTVTYNSPNYEYVLGYQSGSRVGSEAFDIIHPDDIAKAQNLFSRVLEMPGATNTDALRMRHKDGSWRWMESTATNLLRVSAVGAVVANMRDITDYKVAEAALRESEQRLRTILQTALDGFWIIDQHQFFIDVNDAYCMMSGYSREELLGGMRIADIESNETSKNIDIHIRQIVDRGSDRFETQYRRKDGNMFDVEISVHYVDTDGGQVVCFCRDITERRRREDEIRQLNSELEQRVAARTTDLSQMNAELTRALRTKDAFLATMSHELRTPLNGILAFSEMLTEQIAGPLNERQINSVKQIDTSGRHLLTLINDILDLSKIEAGQMEMYPETNLVTEICEASMHFIQQIAIKKGQKLAFTCNDTTALIEIDAKRLKQILVNLLGNAVKFTPNGGKIHLDVQANQQHEQIIFSVEDTGIGIAAEDMERLFQPFTQLDASLARQHEGTGLGLALVRRLTDILGGSVQVASNGHGQGSRFTVTLPWSHPPQAVDQQFTAKVSQKTSKEPDQGTLILLVEDNEITIRALSEYLKHKQYRVAVARNGQEAIMQASEIQPNLILMDVQMPVLDGLTAIKHLRTLPNFATTPIVALTALAMPGDRERCLAVGANEYLSKPVSLRDLAALIAHLLK
ncbi:MAG: PAS domain S-box protein [Oscillochloris sp.]|nr:PAS domain S-box protein [Oscillochloris sp.]